MREPSNPDRMTRAVGLQRKSRAAAGNRGFSLIELLAVVAVIAILASVLLPALSKAKSRAKQVHCISNMKQAVLAVTLYTCDHDDSVPPVQQLDEAGRYEDYLWLLVPYLGSRTREDYRGGDYVSYWRRVAFCTAGENIFIGAVYGTSAEARRRPILPALFMRDVDWEGRPSPKVKTSKVEIPSEALLFTESWLNTAAIGVISPLERKLETGDDGQIIWHNWARPRVHNGGNNTGLLDGHVQWVSYRELWHLDEEGEVTHPFWYPE